jgi:signal transduction histidine kinase
MQRQNQSRSWILLGLGISAVVAAAFGISKLDSWSDRATRHERNLHQLQSAANRLDALEWRAIAKRKVDSDLKSAITQQRQQAILIFNTLQNTAASPEELQKVTKAYQNYANAVDKLLSLLEANQLDKALEVDETEVDPSYDTLYKVIVGETEVASQTAGSLGHWASLGGILIVLSLVAVIGLLFQQYLRANQQLHRIVVENMRRREAELEQERQILESKVMERTQKLHEANTMLTDAMTDLQQSQIQVIQSEKMSMLGQLVAGIAHEINNPVGFLAGNIQPALDYVKDLFNLIDLYQQKYPQPDSDIQDEIESIDLEYLRDDLPKLIGSMKEGVTRIRDISTGLRNFSRSDNTSLVAFNLHEGIDSTLMILKHRLKANEIRPAIEVLKEYGQLPSVECYAGQLNQVFMNLLANAIDAVEDSNQDRSFGEIKANPNQITIKTELDNENQSAIIRIRDNGMGMTDDVKQKIFDHLFTTKGIGKGTGLGLAIAHQIIVEKHGGTLAVSSGMGTGAEFVIAIPIHPDSVTSSA